MVSGARVVSVLAAVLTGLQAVTSASAQTGIGDRAPKLVEDPVTGGCRATKVKFLVSDSQGLNTSSAEYVPAPQTAVNFQKQTEGCVVLHFAGVVCAPGVRAVARRIQIRAVLQGTGAVAVPTDVQISGDDDIDFDDRWARARAMIFVFPNVAPGQYKAVIEWKSLTGHAVFLHQHSVLVRYE